MRWTREAPIDYVPQLAGSRWQGFNDDHDYIAAEPGTGRAEIIRDVNEDGKFTTPPDQIVYAGGVPELQSVIGNFTPRIDKEILDGTDNDGDGLIDEDISNYIFREVDDVYNENLTANAPDVDAYIDLTDDNLRNNLNEKGIVFYSGHSWTSTWNIRNLHGWSRTKDAAGKCIRDNRSKDNVTFSVNEVPKLSPSFVITASCGSSRIWEDDSFHHHCFSGAWGIVIFRRHIYCIGRTLWRTSKTSP